MGSSRVIAALLLLVLVGCGPQVGVRPPNAEDVLLAELAEELNREVPGLAPFFELWDDGNSEGAKIALLAYFRERVIPEKALPEPLPVDQSIVLSGLEAWRGVFSFQGRQGRAAEPDGPIDWGYRGPKGENEWAWFLHRHAFFRDMLLLYDVQGQPEFVSRIGDYLVDWFWQFPPPEKRSFSAAWRALEAARRYGDSWLPVYAELRGNPAFGDEAELAVIAGAARHADYLRHHHHFGGNHLVTEMMALATIAAVWPEFRASPEWMDYALSRSLDELERQVYPDGAHKELANHYQWIAGSSFQRLYEVLVAAGNLTAAERIEPRMEELWDYYAGVVRPDGTGPLNNDSDLEPNAEQLIPLADSYDRPDWLYIATAGEEGERPEGTASRVYPWAGHVVLRSGWDRSADWVFFDAGAFGTDHQQEDRLHISASLMGRNLLVDSGRYVYRDDEWAQYFRGPESHNVPTFESYRRITPDPEANAPQEGLADFSGDLQEASASIPLQRGETGAWTGAHSRKVALGPGFLWVMDQIELAEPDRATFRWRFHPDLDLRQVADAWVADAEGVPVGQWISASTVPMEVEVVRGREKGEIQGWYSPEYNQRVPNSVLVYRTPATTRATVAWLLIAEDAEIEKAFLSVSDSGSRLELIRADGEQVEYTMNRASSSRKRSAE